MIPDHLRLQPGQEALTPEQEAEAERFAQARMAAQLATSPVEKQEAERLLRQAYAVAGLPPPLRLHWLDGPLQYVGAMAPQSLREIIRTSTGASVAANVQASVEAGVGNRISHRLRNSIEASYQASVSRSLLSSIQMSLSDSRKKQVRGSIRARVEVGVGGRVGDSIRDSLHEHLWTSVPDSVWDSVRPRYLHLGSDEDGVWHAVHASTLAYQEAGWLACACFFDEYLAPNAGPAFSRFNELVSGYWLGEVAALLVRRPRVLSRDAEGRLHSETGKCVEYHDGWGFYAWHGVRVPEQIILAPKTLTREEYLREPNVEVRRLIQERMGERFVSELGGVMLNTGPRGTLYEVRLPEDDPERVARYVQVQDTSTPRQYFLRVPPTIQTASEAVAWSFHVAVEEYRPAQET